VWSGRYWLIRHDHRPVDGGSKHFGNIGQLLPVYTAQDNQRQPSSETVSFNTMI
jgi:hypothetical protein